MKVPSALVLTVGLASVNASPFVRRRDLIRRDNLLNLKPVRPEVIKWRADGNATILPTGSVVPLFTAPALNTTTLSLGTGASASASPLVTTISVAPIPFPLGLSSALTLTRTVSLLIPFGAPSTAPFTVLTNEATLAIPLGGSATSSLSLPATQKTEAGESGGILTVVTPQALGPDVTLLESVLCITEIIATPTPSSTTTSGPFPSYPFGLPASATSLLDVITSLLGHVSSDTGIATAAATTASDSPPAAPFLANDSLSLTAAGSGFATTPPFPANGTSNPSATATGLVASASFPITNASSLTATGSGSSPLVPLVANATSSPTGPGSDSPPSPPFPINATLASLPTGSGLVGSFRSSPTTPPFALPSPAGFPGNITIGSRPVSPTGFAANTALSLTAGSAGPSSPTAPFGNITTISPTASPALAFGPTVPSTGIPIAGTGVSPPALSVPPFANSTLALSSGVSGTAPAPSPLESVTSGVGIGGFGSTSTASLPTNATFSPLLGSAAGRAPSEYTVLVESTCSEIEITATVLLSTSIVLSASPSANATAQTTNLFTPSSASELSTALNTVPATTLSPGSPLPLPPTVSQPALITVPTGMLPPSISVPTELLLSPITVPTEALPSLISVPLASLPSPISVPDSVLNSIFHVTLSISGSPTPVPFAPVTTLSTTSTTTTIVVLSLATTTTGLATLATTNSAVFVNTLAPSGQPTPLPAVPLTTIRTTSTTTSVAIQSLATTTTALATLATTSATTVVTTLATTVASLGVANFNSTSSAISTTTFALTTITGTPASTVDETALVILTSTGSGAQAATISLVAPLSAPSPSEDTAVVTLTITAAPPPVPAVPMLMARDDEVAAWGRSQKSHPEGPPHRTLGFPHETPGLDPEKESDRHEDVKKLFQGDDCGEMKMKTASNPELWSRDETAQEEHRGPQERQTVIPSIQPTDCLLWGECDFDAEDPHLSPFHVRKPGVLGHDPGDDNEKLAPTEKKSESNDMALLPELTDGSPSKLVNRQFALPWRMCGDGLLCSGTLTVTLNPTGQGWGVEDSEATPAPVDHDIDGDDEKLTTRQGGFDLDAVPAVADDPDRASRTRIVTAYLTGLPVRTVAHTTLVTGSVSQATLTETAFLATPTSHLSTQTRTTTTILSGGSATIPLTTTTTESTLSTVTTTIGVSDVAPSASLHGTASSRIGNATAGATHSPSSPIQIGVAAKLQVALCALAVCLLTALIIL